MKKLFFLSIVLLLAFSLSIAAVAQEEQKEAKATAATAGKQERWEGMVVRASKDASTITVRKAGFILEREIHYDGSTKFDAQEHGSKKAEPIDPGNIKEGDRVICMGTYDPKGLSMRRSSPSGCRIRRNRHGWAGKGLWREPEAFVLPVNRRG